MVSLILWMENMVHSRHFDSNKPELNSMMVSPCRKYNIQMLLFRWIMLDVIYIGALFQAHRHAEMQWIEWEIIKKTKLKPFRIQNLTYTKLIPLLHQMIVAMCTRLNHTAWIFWSRASRSWMCFIEYWEIRFISISNIFWFDGADFK